VGFAYRLTEDGKTSLRGGLGYYYQAPETVAWTNGSTVAPFTPNFHLTDVKFADPYGSAGIPDPFPAEYGPSIPGPDVTFTLPVTIPQVWNRDFRMPEITTWNLTVARQFFQTWVLSIGYFGNKGTHLYGSGDQNPSQLLNPAIYVPGNSSEANTQQRRMYPNFGPIAYVDPADNSNYNALQVNLEKRVAKSLSLIANYVWSKSMDDFAPLSGTGTVTNPFNRRFDYGPSSDDLTHVAKLSGVWHLPGGKFNGIAGKVVSGWELAPILTWQSGFPFAIYSGVDNSFSGVGGDRADFTGSNLAEAKLNPGRAHGQLISEYFNSALFVVNAVGTFGNTGKNILRGPGYFDTDLALVKNTSLTETKSIQFRAEFFNAFNDVNFGAPGSTLGTATLGLITSASDPRILQFALKLLF
jgi:hypothetical protein